MGWRLEWITIPEKTVLTTNTTTTKVIMMRMMTPDSVKDHSSLDFLIISASNLSIGEKNNHDVLRTTYIGLDQAMCPSSCSMRI